MRSPMPPAPRLPAIDLVKGCAILWVLFIHSQALGGGPLFLYVVNQAVPIFVVLFGLNSELWWRVRSGGDATITSFYASRARRILVPMWAALPVWWALALGLRPPDVVLTRTLPLWHAAGWLSQVGTGWFVTVIIQLVLVFPLLHAARRAGTATVLAAGLACTLACVRFQLRLMALLAGLGPVPGEAQTFFNYFVFSPRLLAHVAFGMWLAPNVGRLGGTAAALSAAAFAACVAGAEGAAGAGLAPYAAALVPLPLTALLLAAWRLLPRLAGVTPALEWLGQSSYGVYLGQLLTHNAFVFALGLGLYQRHNLWLYTAALLAGGLFFVWLGESLRRVARGGIALPSPAR